MKHFETRERPFAPSRLGAAMITVLTACAFAVLLPETAQAAETPTNRHQSIYLGSSSTSPTTIADGIFGTMTVIYGMDVPTSGSQAAATLPAGQTLQGDSVRYFQIVTANSPEFVAVGYVAGGKNGG